MSEAAAAMPAALPTRAEAITEAARVFAAARRERDQLFADFGGGWEGALAVGRAAHPRDPVRVDEAARTYLGWVQEERAKRDATKGSAA